MLISRLFYLEIKHPHFGDFLKNIVTGLSAISISLRLWIICHPIVALGAGGCVRGLSFVVPMRGARCVRAARGGGASAVRAVLCWGTVRTHAPVSSSRHSGIKQRSGRAHVHETRLPACHSSSPRLLPCLPPPWPARQAADSLMLHFVTLLHSTLVVFEFAYVLRVSRDVVCALCYLINKYNK